MDSFMECGLLYHTCIKMYAKSISQIQSSRIPIFFKHTQHFLELDQTSTRIKTPKNGFIRFSFTQRCTINIFSVEQTELSSKGILLIPFGLIKALEVKSHVSRSVAIRQCKKSLTASAILLMQKSLGIIGDLHVDNHISSFDRENIDEMLLNS